MAGASSPPWGWYRLDRSWAESIVAASGVGRGDLVLDVGAGDGALTAPLVRVGARVVAVELHAPRARALRERFADDDVIVVQADAADLRLPRRPFHVVANPPWAITAPLLRRLLSPGSRLVQAHLVVKRPMVRRAIQDRSLGRGWHLAAGANVPRRAFHPAPPIDARVLVVSRRASTRR